MGANLTENHKARWRALLNQPPLALHVLFYLGCLGYAVTVAATNEFYGFRVWANFASIGYGLGLAHSGWLMLRQRTRVAAGRDRWWHSPWVGIGAVGVFGMLVPLAVLIVRRLTGADWLPTPFSWSAQPEVWVIERSADTLLQHGTPYLDVLALPQPPVENDYTPYGPVMSIFGLPRALFGGSPVTDAITDARIMFALTAVLCVWATLKLLNWPRIPILAAWLALAFPLTTLNWSAQGPDLAMLGLLILAVAFATTGRAAAAGVTFALVGSAKFLPLLMVPILLAYLLSRFGKRAAGTFAGTALLVIAAVNLPFFFVDQDAFVENVIRFPTGFGAAASPAASPFPGHLIAATGSGGKAITLVLLAAAAIAILVWLIRRPPNTGSDVLFRIAVSVSALTLLAPATRFGYLVYPAVALGMMLCFRQAEEPELTAGQATFSSRG